MSARRLQMRIVGVVQGVGFRPFVHRLAHEEQLGGWVRNDPEGVTLEVEGAHEKLLRFAERLQRESPRAAVLHAVDQRFIESRDESDFTIRESRAGGRLKTWVLPDLATCDACRNELLDADDRRHRYPFINCTDCGPRFTIIERLPYDRPQTSMRGFVMCDRCQSEYEEPTDRRFHAQPNACPRCGPQLRLWRPDDGVVAHGDDALRGAVQALRAGQILALKGLGGYHIVVDAGNDAAVRELRRRKGRPSKALALMYPDLELMRRHVRLPSYAEPILSGAAAPILLLPRRDAAAAEIAESVAPGSPSLGVFLPYTPVHSLLMADLAAPVVATSGNPSDQPTLHEDEEARSSLRSICDVWLEHDRPILRQADDSVIQVLERPRVVAQFLRRARGYTPLPILAPRELPNILALGGQKNAVFALARDRELILSQHLGDLESYESQLAFRRCLDDFLRLYEIRPRWVAHDLHPDYFTTRLAEELNLPRIAVQHHHAHLAACMLENQLSGSALGLCWDGTGFGSDASVWGGEALRGGAESFEQVASLVPFRLPGGEQAIRQPWRIALALLWGSFGEELPRELPLFRAIDEFEIEGVLQLLRSKSHAPLTTSVGRLFDGVSATLGLCFTNLHQAQAPQQLEYAAWSGDDGEELPLELLDGCPLRLDWRPTLRRLVERRAAGVTVPALARAFHHALVEGALQIVRALGAPRVVLAGGVFCNRYLGERLAERLEEDGRAVYMHSQLPPTDGSLSAGQLWVAAHDPRVTDRA